MNKTTDFDSRHLKSSHPHYIDNYDDDFEDDFNINYNPNKYKSSYEVRSDDDEEEDEGTLLKTVQYLETNHSKKTENMRKSISAKTMSINFN